MAGRQFTQATFSDGQDQVFCRRHLGIPLLRQSDLRDGLILVIRAFIIGRTGNGSAHFQVGNALLRGCFKVPDNRHGHDLVAVAQLDTAHPGRTATRKDPHIRGLEPDRFALRSDQHHVIILGTDARANHPRVRAVLELHGNLAITHDIREIRQLVAPHIAFRRCEHNLQILPLFFWHIDRHHRGNRHAGIDRQHIDNRLASRIPPGQRQAPCLQLVDNAIGGENQDRRMRVCNEETGHEVLVLGRHASQTLAATCLSTEFGQRGALDVTAMRDGDDHVLLFDQVLIIKVTIIFDDLSLTWRRKLFLHGNHLV